MRLVWCQGGNRTSAAMAVAAGWWYGFRSDDGHHAAALGPVALLDSHWETERVDWPRHLATAAEVYPWLATVPDTMSLDELDRTLRQAEEIAPHAENVLIVPKCPGLIERLPREINGKPVVLGYSVPTSYGGTELGVWDFAGWPVHLLGGNPRRQLDLTRYMRVVSCDGNLTWRLARRGIIVSVTGSAGPSIRQMDGKPWPHKDAHLECLRRSLANLRIFWQRCNPEWRPPA